MNEIEALVRTVKLKETKHGVKILAYDPLLTYIGVGRSAAVFRINNSKRVLKVFLPQLAHIAWEEAEIYRMLKDCSYYPKLYESGHGFVVIDYIEGITLFNCLKAGISVTEEMINEVDLALDYAKQKGLNPSDIHLRNIIFTPEGTIKLIDVARFRQDKDCSQWKDLKKAFYTVYQSSLFPKKVPERLLNLTSTLYKRDLLRVVLKNSESTNESDKKIV